MQIDISSFHQTRILVVGDVMLDTYWRGDTNRISPEAPVPVVQVNQFDSRAGGAANVALNAASLGCKVKLVGIVGNDESSECLEKILQKYNVEHEFSKIANIPTIKKLRIISHNNQLIRLDFEKKMYDCNFSELLEIYKRQLDCSDIVILSDYGKGTLGCVKELIKLARSRGVPILIDPKSKDFSIYDGATLITPNLQEFETIVGECNTDEDIVNKAISLIDKHNLEALLVTRGAQGMSLIKKDRQTIHIPARVREVFDVTGAGDTVIATLGAAMAAGIKMEQAVFLANTAAGVVVRKLGTEAITDAELRRALQRQNDPHAGIMSEDDLLKYVEEAKSRGEKIVMTNGCFDILHSGHVLYLEHAKSLGNRLIIAVNDDDSIKRLKGNGRPVNALQERMLVLASLRAVDWVVPFSEDTPERLIKKISPDILAKGGDYNEEQIAGAKHVRATGGEVVIIPFVDGFSTTNMIKKMVTTEKREGEK